MNLVSQSCRFDHVVGDPAEQRHGGVGMRIYQTGREDGIGPIQALLRGVAAVDFGARADVDNVIARDGDGSVFDHVALRIHGDFTQRALQIGDRNASADGLGRHLRRHVGAVMPSKNRKSLEK